MTSSLNGNTASGEQGRKLTLFSEQFQDYLNVLNMSVFQLICYRFSRARVITLPLNAACSVATIGKKAKDVSHKAMVLICPPLCSGHGVR